VRDFSGDEANFNPAAPAGQAEEAEIVVGPGRSLPTLPPEASANKAPTHIRVTSVQPEAFRGEILPLSGALVSRADQRGIGGQRVEVWMAPAGQHGDNAVQVGHTVTAADGAFSVQVSLPDTIELNDYEIFVSTPGDTRFAPAVSE
jgi:hypothetical protein